MSLEAVSLVDWIRISSTVSVFRTHYEKFGMIDDAEYDRIPIQTSASRLQSSRSIIERLTLTLVGSETTLNA